MAKKHSIGVSTFKKNTKIKRKGRHSKSHIKKSLVEDRESLFDRLCEYQ
jgi:hypothetical protein